MDIDFKKRYEKALAAAQLSDKSEPRAKDAHYDKKNRRIVVDLSNDSTFIFPSALAPGLADASSSEIVAIEITPSGDGLRWDSLDIDLSLSGLLAGIFGTSKRTADLGRATPGIRNGKNSTTDRETQPSRRRTA